MIQINASRRLKVVAALKQDEVFKALSDAGFKGLTKVKEGNHLSVNFTAQEDYDERKLKKLCDKIIGLGLGYTAYTRLGYPDVEGVFHLIKDGVPNDHLQITSEGGAYF